MSLLHKQLDRKKDGSNARWTFTGTKRRELHRRYVVFKFIKRQYVLRHTYSLSLPPPLSPFVY